MFFIGEQTVRADNKGRIVMPAIFKKQIEKAGIVDFVLRRDLSMDCLLLCSEEDWQNEVALVRSKIDPFNEEHKIFLTNFFRGILPISLDGSGRLNLPEDKCRLVGIDKDIVLIGAENTLQIWAKSELEKVSLSSSSLKDSTNKLLTGK